MSYAYIRKERAVSDWQQISALCAKSKLKKLVGEKLDDAVIAGIKAKSGLYVADVAALGTRYEEVLTTLQKLAQKQVVLCVAQENLRINTAARLTFSEQAELCLILYKKLFSIRNKSTQLRLKQAGLPRGRPYSGHIGKARLDGLEEQIVLMLKSGKNKSEIARALNIGRTTLYMHIKRKQLMQTI